MARFKMPQQTTGTGVVGGGVRGEGGRVEDLGTSRTHRTA